MRMKATKYKSIPLDDWNQERFCQEYTVDGNASQAYVRAGYVANTGNASRLYNQIHIRLRIAQLEAELYDHMSVTRERVVNEMEKIAFADPRDFHCPKTGRLLMLHELNDRAAAAIKEVECCPITGRPIKYKVEGKRGVLQDLGRTLNIFESHEKAGSGEIHIHMDEKDAKA